MTAPGTLRGILFLVASMAMFAMVDGLSKMLVETQSFGQIMLARYALGLPILMLATGARGLPGLFRTSRPGLQLLRGCSPLMVGGAMTLALVHLPLAEATVILFAGPFLVVALSGPLLGEKVGLSSWAAVAVGFLAVLMVTRPGFGGLSIYVLYALLAAVFYAALQLLSRLLADRGEQAMTTLAWTLALGLGLSLPLAIVQWQPVPAAAWPLFIGLAVSFGLGQLCLVEAYRTAAANVLAPFSYTQIAFAAMFGYAAFGDVPDGWALLGIGLIVVAGVTMVVGRRE